MAKQKRTVVQKPWTPTTFDDDRRVSHPASCLRADYGNSPRDSIAEYCRACLQASTASDCTHTSCHLFRWRPGAKAKGAVQRISGVDVPTEAWYAERIRELDPDGSKAAKAAESGKRLAERWKARKEGVAGETEEGDTDDSPEEFDA